MDCAGYGVAMGMVGVRDEYLGVVVCTLHIINIAKGTTDPRVEFISQVITQILTKQFHNLD